MYVTLFSLSTSLQPLGTRRPLCLRGRPLRHDHEARYLPGLAAPLPEEPTPSQAAPRPPESRPPDRPPPQNHIPHRTRYVTC
jgi:hypothetical protein